MHSMPTMTLTPLRESVHMCERVWGPVRRQEADSEEALPSWRLPLSRGLWEVRLPWNLTDIGTEGRKERQEMKEN